MINPDFKTEFNISWTPIGRHSPIQIHPWKAQLAKLGEWMLELAPIPIPS
jgi:hypothetical protein